MLCPLAKEAIKHLKKGGYIITSGIIDEKENEVKEALLLAGFTIDEITHQGEWVSITAVK